MKMKTKDDYPMVLTVKEIMEILHIGRRVAYELMDQEGFPTIRIGSKLKRVNRDQFFIWLESQGNKG
ncbi:DNA-binding protein [Bacillus obstructivus]|nr:DNA-binding protein [Bacillus obstructivus]